MAKPKKIMLRDIAKQASQELNLPEEECYRFYTTMHNYIYHRMVHGLIFGIPKLYRVILTRAGRCFMVFKARTDNGMAHRQKTRMI